MIMPPHVQRAFQAMELNIKPGVIYARAGCREAKAQPSRYGGYCDVCSKRQFFIGGARRNTGCCGGGVADNGCAVIGGCCSRQGPTGISRNPSGNRLQLAWPGLSWWSRRWRSGGGVRRDRGYWNFDRRSRYNDSYAYYDGGPAPTYYGGGPYYGGHAYYGGYYGRSAVPRFHGHPLANW
jgi:hypothetical protein